MIGLHGRHGVIVPGSFAVLLLQILKATKPQRTDDHVLQATLGKCWLPLSSFPATPFTPVHPLLTRDLNHLEYLGVCSKSCEPDHLSSPSICTPVLLFPQKTHLSASSLQHTSSQHLSWSSTQGPELLPPLEQPACEWSFTLSIENVSPKGEMQ